MKKALAIISILVCTIFFSSCDIIKFPDNNKPQQEESNIPDNNSSENTQGDTNQSSNYSIKDYFPFKENIKYTFEGKGNEYASFTMYIDFIKGNKIQIRKNNGGTETVSVIESNNGQLKTVFSKEEAYYREDFTSKPSNKDEVLLKEPLVKGTSWTLSDGRKRFISQVNVPVSTPAGNFTAIEVTTEDKGSKNLDYYGLNTGLVKSVYSSNGMEVSSTLKELKSNTPLTQTVKFYYPNINDEKLYYTQKKLSFKTNDLTKLSFEKLFKEAPSKSVGSLIGPNAKIMSLYLNSDVVYVDFTKELVTEMNAGAGYEALILQGITNTLGGYYGVNKVYITVENKPYESGHISMKKGQTFTVNTKNTAQLK